MPKQEYANIQRKNPQEIQTKELEKPQENPKKESYEDQNKNPRKT